MTWKVCGLWILAATLAAAQASSAGAAGDDDQKAVTPASSLPMDAPVLTIRGYCPEQKTKAATAGCQTSITRAEFEAMVAAIRPDMSMSAKQQLANLYPRLLVMSQKAEQAGLDKQAPYQQSIAFSRMQILTQAYTRKVQQDSGKVSDAEIAAYFQNHQDDFYEYTLERLVVPLHKQPGTARPTDKKDAEAEKKSDQELSYLAQALRSRAAAGEDFVKLQKEAFDAAGVKVASVNTHMQKVRRPALPANQPAILELKAGEVSPVITDAGGHYIYKLDEKNQLTLDEAKNEIRQALAAQHYKDFMDKIDSSFSADRNEAYFNVPPAEDKQ